MLAQHKSIWTAFPLITRFLKYEIPAPFHIHMIFISLRLLFSPFYQSLSPFPRTDR